MKCPNPKCRNTNVSPTGECMTCGTPGPQRDAEQERRSASLGNVSAARLLAEERDHEVAYGSPHPADDPRADSGIFQPTAPSMNGDKPDTRYPSPAMPMAVGRKLEVKYRHGGGKNGPLTLRSWRGDWMHWKGAHWAGTEKEQIRSWTYRQLEHAKYAGEDGEDHAWSPNRSKVLDVLDSLAAITHLPQDVDSPCWLGESAPWPDGTIVSCANGLLHVGTRRLYDPSPQFFNLVSVPFAYDADAPEPAEWLAFLRQLWPDDPQSIEALQEWFGYILSGRTDLHKIMLMIGPTRSGKGTIARVLSALIGRGNTAWPTLASMGTNFGMMPLLGKPVAIVADARLNPKDSRVVVERLLSISGEDMQTVDRKYKEPWTGKMPCRFMILSNELPSFGDASGAIAGRFVILQMSASFLGKEDTGLIGRLLRELPGILNWSLQGLERLDKNGALTMPQSSADAVGLLQDLASPIKAFIRERCILGAAQDIAVDDLYALWRSWCELNGHDHPGNAQTFGRNLRAAVPSLGSTQPRTPTGGRERRYTGIGRAS